MAEQSPLNRALLTPGYWAGNDIFSPDIFLHVEASPGTYLSKAEFNEARTALIFGLGEISMGNATDIRYPHADQFDTDLSDGSLIVLDTEHLGRWEYDDPEREWEPHVPRKHDRLTRPYTDYWLSRQPRKAGSKEIGAEAAVFTKEKIRYSRLLDWGVLTTHQGSRCIQTFSFNGTRIDESGSIYVPRYRRGLQLSAIPMPVAIGAVTVKPRLDLGGVTIDSMSRVRSVDVVYPAAPKKPKGRKLRLYMPLAVPKRHPATS